MANPHDLTGFPVNSISIVIAYETQNGIEEVVHVIDGKKVDILSFSHNVERKVKPIKEVDGSVRAHEATGEEILFLKAKYVRGL